MRRLRILVIDPTPTRRALARRAITRVSARIRIEEASDPAAIARMATSDAPDAIVAPRAIARELQAALPAGRAEVPVLAIVNDAGTASGAFALVPERDLASSLHDEASAARIAQAVRRAAWFGTLERAANEDARARARSALTRPLQALHVEDSPAAVAYTRQLLQPVGIDLTACTHAREALEAVQRARFDAVLVDSQLPDATGASVARHLAQLTPPTALIGLTSSSEPDAERQFFAAGAWAYLEKRDAVAASLALAIRQSVRMSILWFDGDDARSKGTPRPDMKVLPPV